jgi:hypothetical protein
MLKLIFDILTKSPGGRFICAVLALSLTAFISYQAGKSQAPATPALVSMVSRSELTQAAEKIRSLQTSLEKKSTQVTKIVYRTGPIASKTVTKTTVTKKDTTVAKTDKATVAVSSETSGVLQTPAASLPQWSATLSLGQSLGGERSYGVELAHRFIGDLWVVGTAVNTGQNYQGLVGLRLEWGSQ